MTEEFENIPKAVLVVLLDEEDEEDLSAWNEGCSECAFKEDCPYSFFLLLDEDCDDTDVDEESLL